MKKYYIGIFVIIFGGILFAFSQFYSKNNNQDIYATLSSSGTLTISSNEIKNNQKNKIITNYGKIDLNQFFPNWNKNAKDIKKVFIVDDIYPTSCYQWFYDCENLIEIKNIDKLHTNKCTDIERMFYNCKKIKYLNLSNFDISKCERIGEMFANCENLQELNLTSFDTKNIKDMRYIFENCRNLKEIKVSKKWKLDGIKKDGMFNNCKTNKFIIIEK